MIGTLPNKCKIEYFDTSNNFSHEILGDCIIKYMCKVNLSDYTPVLLCIGTDRATGDCLGPLVGEMLQNYNNRFLIMGNLKHPVHALNLHETIQYIQNKIKNPFVIAIDASLGSVDHVGYITVSNCPIAPGKGVHKKLPEIGDLSITGIVNISGKNPNLLQSTRLNIVMQLAVYIADAIKYYMDFTK